MRRFGIVLSQIFRLKHKMVILRIIKVLYKATLTLNYISIKQQLLYFKFYILIYQILSFIVAHKICIFINLDNSFRILVCIISAPKYIFRSIDCHMPRNPAALFQASSTYFEVKVNNFNIFCTFKNDFLCILAQYLFSQGLIFQSNFSSGTMPEILKMYFRTSKELYDFITDSPEQRLKIDIKGIITLVKRQDGLQLPRDVQFQLTKIEYNSQRKKQIQIMKDKQRIASLQHTINRQNDVMNRIKQLNSQLIRQNKILRFKLSKKPVKVRVKRDIDLTNFQDANKVIMEDGQQVTEVIQVADQQKYGDLLQFCQKNKIIELRKQIQTKSIEFVKELCLNVQNIPNIPPFPFLHNLQILSMENNQISKIRNLNQLRNLQQLHLSNNRIDRIQGLTEMKYLRVLQLNYNKITKMENLEKLQSLEQLFLKKNQIKVIEAVDKLVMLQQLDLEQNIVNEITQSIKNLKSLKILNLKRNCCPFLSDILLQLDNLKQIFISCKGGKLGKFDPESEENMAVKLQLQINQVQIYTT